jgi:ribosomal protein L1
MPVNGKPIINRGATMTNTELIENIKTLINTYQRQKEEYTKKSDIEGRYFAAGQISALKLVLEMIEAKK